MFLIGKQLGFDNFCQSKMKLNTTSTLNENLKNHPFKGGFLLFAVVSVLSLLINRKNEAN